MLQLYTIQHIYFNWHDYYWIDRGNFFPLNLFSTRNSRAEIAVRDSVIMDQPRPQAWRTFLRDLNLTIASMISTTSPGNQRKMGNSMLMESLSSLRVGNLSALFFYLECMYVRCHLAIIIRDYWGCGHEFLKLQVPLFTTTTYVPVYPWRNTKSRAQTDSFQCLCCVFQESVGSDAREKARFSLVRTLPLSTICWTGC